MIFSLLPTRVYRAYYGGKNLDILEKKDNPRSTRFPEDWLASVTCAFNPDRVVENEGMSKTCDGRFLKDIINENKHDMIGQREEMSLLFKLLDSSERLVIQVHPTIPFAKKHFNSNYGKTECWYILGNEGEVYLGFKEGITKEYWKELFDKQDVDGMLKALHRFDVKKGDFIFVEGGVPHAIGKNCFLAELQEPTDLMVIPEKVTPSGVVLAEKKLHCGLGFEKMFDCFEYKGLDEKTTRERYFRNPKVIDESLSELVLCDKFRLYEIKVDGEYTYNADSYAIAVVVSGNVNISGTALTSGDRVFISENERELKLCGNGKVLVCQP